MNLRPFRNNLVQNDRIVDTVTKKQGKVARTPKNDKNRMTCVQYDGQSAQRYVDVMQLRLMPDGRTPEEVPPIDGEPPALEEPSTKAAPPRPWPSPPASSDPVENIEAELKLIEIRMSEINEEFRTLDGRKAKYRKALEALRS